MKKLFILLALIGVALPVYAENMCMFSDGTTTMPLCDSNRALEVTTSASSGLASEYAEDSAHTSTDVGTFVLGVRNQNETAIGGADGDYTPFAVNRFGAAYANIDVGFQSGAAQGLLKREDTGHTTGDALVGIAGVRRDAAGTECNVDEDYCAVSVNDTGAFMINQDRRWQSSDANALLKAEDAAASDGDAGISMLGVRNTGNTGLAGANFDYEPLQLDALGSLWTAGAQVEDTASASGDRGMSMLGKVDLDRGAEAGDGDYSFFKLDGTQSLWTAGAQVEDAAAAGGDRVVAAGAVRDDALEANGSVTNDGDYSVLRTDNLGALYVDNVGASKFTGATPTVDNAADYAAGDSVGGIMTLSSAFRTSVGYGSVRQIRIGNKDGETAALQANIDVCFWHSSPAGTFTDNAATDPSNADVTGALCGCVSVTDHVAFSATGLSQAQDVNLKCGDSTDTNLYATMTAREAIGAGAGYSATDALTLSVWIDQD